MTYSIIKDVPVKTKERPGRKQKYPFATMQVGDSFSIPAEDVVSNGAGLYKSAKRHGIKITLRSENGGLLVWRIE